MKLNCTRKLYLDLTLDSSEAVMFNQGGKFKINVPEDYFHEDNKFDDIEISFQLEKQHQGRHDFITTEAAKNIQRRNDETQSP